MTYLINIILLFIWIIVTIALCFTGIGLIFILINEWGWIKVRDEIIGNLV